MQVRRGSANAYRFIATKTKALGYPVDESWFFVLDASETQINIQALPLSCLIETMSIKPNMSRPQNSKCHP